MVALSATVFSSRFSGDFSLFVDIARDMRSVSGLHVYAHRPNVQSGPVTLVMVLVLDALGRRALPIAVGGMCAVVLAVLARSERDRDRSLLVVGLGGAVLVLWWRLFAFQGHPDDALVFTLAVLAVAAARRDRPLVAAVLLGVTLAVKPWAVFLLPLSLRPGDAGPRRLLWPAVSLAVGGALWAPFLVADTSTLTAMKPTVWLAPDSVLRLLTGSRFAEAPSWLRIVQLAVATAVVAWVVLRGHPACAVLAGVATRVMLDPGAWPYYSVGVVLGALWWDLEESNRRLPVATLVVSALLPMPTWLPVPEVRALLRFVACSGSLLVVATTVLGHRAHTMFAGLMSAADLPKNRS